MIQFDLRIFFKWVEGNHQPVDASNSSAQTGCGPNGRKLAQKGPRQRWKCICLRHTCGYLYKWHVFGSGGWYYWKWCFFRFFCRCFAVYFHWMIATSKFYWGSLGKFLGWMIWTLNFWTWCLMNSEIPSARASDFFFSKLKFFTKFAFFSMKRTS